MLNFEKTFYDIAIHGGIHNVFAFIKREDWFDLEKVVKDFGVKTVLEFGAGVSSALFKQLGCELVSLEHNPKFMAKVESFVAGIAGPDAEFIHWKRNQKPQELGTRKFDLAFVDGAQPRDLMVSVAKARADIVAIHDIYLDYVKHLHKNMMEDDGWNTVLVNNSKLGLGVYKRCV